MVFNEFFTDGDKPYSENLNDALLLLDAFDVTVPVELPGMFSNGGFSSSLGTPRKAGVGVVTLQSVDSGVTVGTSSISGSGAIVFRVYPNFNSFYKWQSIILENTGTVEVSFKKTDGTSISATVGADGVISDAAALKVLQEIDVVLTLTSATITDILINFVNNQSGSRTRSTAILNADNLSNVDGTISSGNDKVVNGGTVYTALTIKEDRSNKVSSWSGTTNNTRYPTEKLVKDSLDGKAASSHTHGNVTNDGKIGSTANKPVVTGTGGALTTGSFEATATNIKMNGTQAVGSLNTFARADHVHPVDTSRVAVSDIKDNLTSTDTNKPLSAKQGKELKTLVDGKAASSHAHGNLQSNGQVGSTVAANKNVVTDSNGKITTADAPVVPTKTSDLTNDSGFLTSHQSITGKEDKSNKTSSWNSTTNDTRYPTEKLVKTSLDNKVDKVSGKGLSTNDYTTTEKNKLAGIATSANNYTHPSSHASSMITEASALGNLETSANATQATINSAINTKIGGKANSSHTHTYDSLTSKPSAFTPASHTHGNITNAGVITNQASKNVVTDANGKITTEAKPTIPTKTSQLANDSGFLTSHQDLSNYVTTSDSRLSDSRTPTSHTHGNISNAGVISGQASKNVVTDANGKITTEAKYSHPSYTALTGKPIGAVAIAFGGSFTGSQVITDATGHVTALTDRVFSIPSLPTASTTKAGVIQIGTGASNAAAGNHTHTTWTETSLTNGKLYVNTALKICELHYTKSVIMSSTYSNFATVETISQITSYPPKSIIYAATADTKTVARLKTDGALQIKSERTSSEVAVNCNFMWHY